MRKRRKMGESREVNGYAGFVKGWVTETYLSRDRKSVDGPSTVP